MAGTIVNNMTAINNCETTGDWSDGGEAAYTFSREGTNCMGNQASEGSLESYDSITSDNKSAKTIHAWMWMHGNPDVYANVGFGIQLGDGTNRAAFQCGGNDKAGFASVPQGWQCFILSVPDKDDTTAVNLAGTTASIDDTAITEVGIYFDSLGKALGNVDNIFWDMIWEYTHTGYAIEITAGTSGSPATFSDFITWDESTATDRATGAMAEIATGVYAQQAPIQIGDDGTGSSYFSATNEEVIFSDVDYINNHKFKVVGNATGTNEVYFSSVTFRNAHSTLTPTLDFNDGNLDNLEFDGCSFLGIDADFSNSADATGHSVTNSTFDGCAQIDPGDVAFGSVTFANPSDANGGLLLDADGPTNLTNISFISDGTGHGVYLDATVDTSITITNWTFSNFGSTGTTDAAIYNDSGKAITITIDGGDTPTYRNGSGASTNIVAGAVTVQAKAALKAGTAVENARVFLKASDGTGPFPFEETVTSISRSGTTATVEHLAHGMDTNDKIYLEGITDKTEDNWRVIQITKIDADSYSFTTTDSGSTNYTGTIKCTFVALNGLTNASGLLSTSRVYTSDQPVTGWTRKSTSSPLLQEGVLVGTVDSADGFNGTAVMLDDE